VSLQELLEKIKYVKYELEEVRHNYEITRLAIQREISTCSEKSALVDSYLIALLALSDKLEHQLREIQTLQDEYRECKGMTEILMNSGDDGSPMRYAAICNSITIGNRRGDYIRIDEKAMILKYKIDEIKSYIKEVNKEFDFLKSTKQRLILTLDDLPF